MDKSSGSNREDLENMGIIPPPTSIGCKNLIAFLSLRWRGTTKSERIAMVRCAQQKWIGAQVTVKTGGSKEIKTIDYLIAKGASELVNFIRSGGDKRNSPFLYHVTGTNSCKSLGSLCNPDGTEIAYEVPEKGF